jgi:DNA sulfur modification protein DndB
MLKIPAIVGFAWVVDGQHRLLSYAGHRYAETAALPVTAFDGLDTSKEAQLFEEINSKQKKVSASLLNELYASLHMDSASAKSQVGAMASAAIDVLARNKGAAFYGRVLRAEERKNEKKCITLNSFMGGLREPGFFFYNIIQDKYQSFGPLWAGTSHESVSRAANVLDRWFQEIRSECCDEWDIGEDGIVATNRGVTSSLRVLRDVFIRLKKRDHTFDTWDEDQIAEAVVPYGKAVGRAFHELFDSEFDKLRVQYGAGATPAFHFTLVRHMRETCYPDFESDGFTKWEAEHSEVDVQEAMSIVQESEKRLMQFVRRVMEEQHGDSWWQELLVDVRKQAVARREEKNDPSADQWLFLELIDHRAIVLKNWSLFKDKLSWGAKQGKDEATKWMVELNEIRKDTFHAAGMRLKSEQVSTLREIAAFLDSAGLT